MMMRRARPILQDPRSRALAVLAGGALGFALNLYPVYLYGGVWLFVGQIPALACALLLGPVGGVVAAAGAIAGLAIGTLNAVPFISPTQGATWLLLLLEVAAVGELARRRGPIVAVLLYWSVIGAPGMGLFLLVVRAMPLDTVALVVGKNVLGGLFNVGAAAILTGMPLLAAPVGPAGRQRDSIVAQLNARISSVVAVPVLIAMVVVSRWSQRTAEAAAFDRLQLGAASEAKALSVYLIGKQRLVELLSRVVVLDIGKDARARSALLREVQAGGSGFLTMLIADSSGRVSSVARGSTGTVPLSALDAVDDRPYFREPMRTARPFLSSVFRGRGFGSDLVAAISAPMLSAGGHPIGVVEGSLDLSHLGIVFSKPAGITITAVDQDGHVAYTTATDRPVMAALPTGIDFRRHGVGRVFNNSPKLITSRRETLFAVAPAALGWSVLIETPRFVALRDAELSSSAVFLVCVLLFAASLASVRFANRVVTEPLVDLEAQAVGLQWGASTVEPTTATRARRSPREIAVVRDALSNASKRIGESFLSTQRALADRDVALAERDQTVRHLDTLVQERTTELRSERDRAAAASVAKSAFLANMSHELRTPLNVMLGRTEAFAEGVYGPLTPAQREAFSEVDAQGRHLLTLIGDILDLARIESGKLSVDMLDVDVLPLLREVVASLQDIATLRGVALSLDASVNTCVVHADAFRLRQIIVNLVGNAVKFTNSGGRVQVAVEVSNDGTPVAIHVADTGIGILADRIPVIFGAFEQADVSATRVHGGAGLGLTICRTLSEAMGMRVSVVSEVGRGSTFSVHFAGAYPATWPAPRAGVAETGGDPA